MQQLTQEKYKICAGSKIRDTIFKIIDKHISEKDITVIIFTDGMDFGSTTSSETVRLLVTAKKNDGWDFHFRSIGFNVGKMSEELGFVNDDISSNISLSSTHEYEIVFLVLA